MGQHRRDLCKRILCGGLLGDDMKLQLGLEPIHGIYNSEDGKWEEGHETVTDDQWA